MRHSHHRLAIVPAVLAFGLALLLAPADAAADGKHRRHRHKHKGHHHSQRIDHYWAGPQHYAPPARYWDHHRPRHRRFEVPRHIHRRQLETYRPYYYGRHYHNPHRHHHEVYRFPVYLPTGVVYQPYAYCDGAYFSLGYFGPRGLHFDLRLGF